VRAVITEEPGGGVARGGGGSVGAGVRNTNRSAREDAFYTLRGVLEVKRVLAKGVERVRLGA
jgi:hypothetical protein